MSHNFFSTIRCEHWTLDHCIRCMWSKVRSALWREIMSAFRGISSSVASVSSMADSIFLPALLFSFFDAFSHIASRESCLPLPWCCFQTLCQILDHIGDYETCLTNSVSFSLLSYSLISCSSLLLRNPRLQVLMPVGCNHVLPKIFWLGFFLVSYSNIVFVGVFFQLYPLHSDPIFSGECDCFLSLA